MITSFGKGLQIGDQLGRDLGTLIGPAGKAGVPILAVRAHEARQVRPCGNPLGPTRPAVVYVHGAAHARRGRVRDREAQRCGGLARRVALFGRWREGSG